MSKSADNAGKREPRFEEAIAQIEDVIERIESGRLGLEESIADYERGMKLLAKCQSVLNQLERKVAQLSSENDKLRVVEEGEALEVEVEPEEADQASPPRPAAKPRAKAARAPQPSEGAASPPPGGGGTAPEAGGDGEREEDLPF